MLKCGEDTNQFQKIWAGKNKYQLLEDIIRLWSISHEISEWYVSYQPVLGNVYIDRGRLLIHINEML